jgi:4-hydroxy-3-methylbut-2-enyl diphosphate reductase
MRLLQRDSVVSREDTVIIRAHGISPGRRLHLESLGCKIVDCTCPLVRRIARVIAANKCKKIFLLGDRNHAEIEGLCGYAENICVCENLAELAQYIDSARDNYKNIVNICKKQGPDSDEACDWVMVCQSTLDMDFFGAARILCKKKHFPVEIFDTICPAAKARQCGLEALKNCDAAVVVGGFHSANTRRLFEKIGAGVPCVFWVEDAAQAAEIDLAPYKKIGIAAGASTPRDVLRQIFDEISKKFKKIA